MKTKLVKVLGIVLVGGLIMVGAGYVHIHTSLHMDTGTVDYTHSTIIPNVATDFVHLSAQAGEGDSSIDLERDLEVTESYGWFANPDTQQIRKSTQLIWLNASINSSEEGVPGYIEVTEVYPEPTVEHVVTLDTPEPGSGQLDVNIDVIRDLPYGYFGFPGPMGSYGNTGSSGYMGPSEPWFPPGF